MAVSDSFPSIPPPAPPTMKENVTPISPKIKELTESRQELLTRLQNLKQDLQSWRTKMDTQVKGYCDELSEIKKSVNTEKEQLLSVFQELKINLQQQQEDVTATLRNLGNDSRETKRDEDLENVENIKVTAQDSTKEDFG